MPNIGFDVSDSEIVKLNRFVVNPLVWYSHNFLSMTVSFMNKISTISCAFRIMCSGTSLRSKRTLATYNKACHNNITFQYTLSLLFKKTYTCCVYESCKVFVKVFLSINSSNSVHKKEVQLQHGKHTALAKIAQYTQCNM